MNFSHPGEYHPHPLRRVGRSLIGSTTYKPLTCGLSARYRHNGAYLLPLMCWRRWRGERALLSLRPPTVPRIALPKRRRGGSGGGLEVAEGQECHARPRIGGVNALPMIGLGYGEAVVRLALYPPAYRLYCPCDRTAPALLPASPDTRNGLGLRLFAL